MACFDDLKPISRPVQDLWLEALEKLKANDKTTIKIVQVDRLKILREVLSIVKEKELACREKRWRWKTKKGETVILRDILAKIIVWVEKFRGIGDTMFQYDAGHAAIPWAVARFVLQTAINDIQTNGAILSGLELVFNLITKFEVVERLYLPKQSTIHTRLTESLVALYASILQYLVQAKRYFTQTTSKRIIKSIFQLEEMTIKFTAEIKTKAKLAEEYVRLLSGEIINNTESKLCQIGEKLESLELRLGNLDRSDLSSETSQDFLQVNVNLNRLWKELNEPISWIASRLSVIDDNLEAQERLQLFDWLSKIPYTSHHRRKAKFLLPGSGKWLLRKSEFAEWINSSSSSILWLHGIPGCGKSMLVAQVIEYMKFLKPENPESTSLAYFYCTRSAHEPERADPEEVLRSIVEQLSCTTEDIPVKLPVADAYLKRRKEARGRRPEKLDLEDCVEMILSLLGDDPAAIILDGLDELDPTRRQDLLDALTTILRASPNVVKVFVSSRDDHDLVNRFAQVPAIYVQAADNKEDIEKFVISSVDEAIKKKRILCGKVSNGLRGKIIETLNTQSKGMFHLVSLHIESLCNPDKIKTEANVLDSINHLPVDLKRSYGAILEKIGSSQNPNPKLAERIFKWLLCASEPLRASAFLLAICSDINENGMLQLSDLSIPDVLSICCNLVIYDVEEELFRFAHLSVREHLEGLEEYSFQNSNALAAEQSLSWVLSAGSFNNTTHNRTLNAAEESFAFEVFWHHADNAWAEYARLAGQRREQGQLRLRIQSLLLPGTQCGNHVFAEWVLRVCKVYWSRGTDYLTETHKSLRYYFNNIKSDPLFVACAYNFPEIVSNLTSGKPLNLICGKAAVVYHSHESLNVILDSVAGQNLPTHHVVLLAVEPHIVTLGIEAAILGNHRALVAILSKLKKNAFTSHDLWRVMDGACSRCLPLNATCLKSILQNNPDLQVTEGILKPAIESFNNWQELGAVQHRFQTLFELFEIRWEQLRGILGNGRDTECLRLLFLMKAKLTEEALHGVVASCNTDVVTMVLRYQTIDITDAVIRATATNIEHGEKIMCLLLEKEMEI